MAPSVNAPQLTCNHLADSQPTNQRYVSHPFEQSGRNFYPGDIGNRDTNGSSVLPGQNDHTAKIDKSYSIEYWRKRLAPVRPTVFPLRTSSYVAVADSSILRRFPVAYESLIRDHGIKLSTLLTLAYALVLSAHSGSSDEVVFGRIHSGQR